MTDIAAYNLHKDLSSLEITTLLIYGEDEPVTTISGPELDKAIPNTKLTVIKKSGHFPFIEQPDKFFQQLRSFLETRKKTK